MTQVYYISDYIYKNVVSKMSEIMHINPNFEHESNIFKNASEFNCPVTNLRSFFLKKIKIYSITSYYCLEGVGVNGAYEDYGF